MSSAFDPANDDVLKTAKEYTQIAAHGAQSVPVRHFIARWEKVQNPNLPFVTSVCASRTTFVVGITKLPTKNNTSTGPIK